MIFDLTVTTKPFTWYILMWNHKILLANLLLANLMYATIFFYWAYFQWTYVSNIQFLENTPICFGDDYTLHHFAYCVNNQVFIGMMLIFLNKTDTSNCFGQVESQFVSNIQNIVYLFIFLNQLIYPLLYKIFGEISLQCL